MYCVNKVERQIENNLNLEERTRYFSFINIYIYIWLLGRFAPNFLFSICIFHIYKEVISVCLFACLFVCPIITQEPLDWFVSNFEELFGLVKFLVLPNRSLIQIVGLVRPLSHRDKLFYKCKMITEEFR